jgi:hypothetical protein
MKNRPSRRDLTEGNGIQKSVEIGASTSTSTTSASSTTSTTLPTLTSSTEINHNHINPTLLEKVAVLERLVIFLLKTNTKLTTNQST